MSQHLVFDNGSYNIKAGFAGGEVLKIHNAISKTKDGIIRIGNEYQTHTSNYSGILFKRPFEQGHLTSWETEKPIWDYVFDKLSPKKELDPSLIHLTLTETPFQLPQLSTYTDQIVFEEYGFGDYYRCVPGSLIPWVIKNEEEEEEAKKEMIENEQKIEKEPEPKKQDEDNRRKSTGSDKETSTDNSESKPENPDDASDTSYEDILTAPPGISDFMLVIDSGYNATWIIPMIFQTVHWPGVRKLPVGGKLLNGLLREVISFRHYDVSDEPILVNTIKESACFITNDYYATLASKQKHACEFVLPDFKTTTTGFLKTKDTPLTYDQQTLKLADERFSVPEAFYHPEIIFDSNSSTASSTIVQNTTLKNLSDLVVEAIYACPVTARPLLLANISLVGGTTYLPNFEARLVMEITKELPLQWFVRIRKGPESMNVDELSWQGGVNLAGEDVMGNISISKKEYFEHGSNWCQKQFGFKNV